VILCASAALAFAGPASAAFRPKITVKDTSRGVSVDARVAASDDATAQVQMYVPAEYDIGSPRPGAVVGGAAATAQFADLGATLPLSGALRAVAPSQQASCLGDAEVAQTWNLHLARTGQALDVPIFVVATTGVEQALAAFKLVICLSPPDVPAGTPGRAPLGAKILSVTFTSSALTAPASGQYRWRSLWTPYSASTGATNPAATVEVQSVVRIPTQLRITVKKTRLTKLVGVNGRRVKQIWTLATITAALTANGKGIRGVPVTLTSNTERLKIATTSASGTVTASVLFRTGTLRFGASATVADRDLGPAGCVMSATPPCTDATIAGGKLSAPPVDTDAYTP
jgi:hypothetical protein